MSEEIGKVWHCQKDPFKNWLVVLSFKTDDGDDCYLEGCSKYGLLKAVPCGTGWLVSSQTKFLNLRSLEMGFPAVWDQVSSQCYNVSIFLT